MEQTRRYRDGEGQAEKNREKWKSEREFSDEGKGN
jgi:hypothetical protein